MERSYRLQAIEVFTKSMFIYQVRYLSRDNIVIISGLT
jgi:hypothetical protein